MNALILLALAAQPLELSEVIRSLDDHPSLSAAAFGVDAASASRLAADGAFDFGVKAQGSGTGLGTWRKASGGLGLSQRLPVAGGPKLGVEYRYGLDFPSWDGGKVTSELGEVRASLSAELGRGLLIDDARAAVSLAGFAEDDARAGLDEVRLKLTQRAASAYWSWVAAGHRLRIATELLRVAEDRMIALERQVTSGARAPIVLEDNRRLVLSRRGSVVDARRSFELAAQTLGFYTRDEAGEMQPPEPTALPSLPEPMATELTLEAAEALLDTRPELRRIEAAREQLRVDRRLAENALWPRVTAELSASQDLGDSVTTGLETTSNKPEVFARLRFDLPTQRRKARGALLRARAKQSVLDAGRARRLDELRVELRGAHARVVAAEEKLDFAERALAAARRLQSAEQQRFEQGQADLLAVNLRETMTASDARTRIDARTSLAAANANFRLVAGLSAVP